MSGELLAHTLTLIAWFVLLLCSSVFAGIGLEERREMMLWSAVGIALLVIIRAIVWIVAQ